jgi:hypothetical protein
MRTITPFAKLGLAGIVGLLGWFAAPAATAFAHDRDHRGHDRGYDHDRGRHEGWRNDGWRNEGWRNEGWRNGGGRPIIQVQVAHPTYVHPGRVWVPGYWGWHARRRIWVEGAWAVPPEPNMVWVPPQQIWDERSRQWVWAEGHWAPAAGTWGS